MARLLDTVGPEVREEIESLGFRRRFPARSYLFMAGEPSGNVFIVEEGMVRIERTTARGRIGIIELSTVGDLIGELSALDNSPRSATALTISPTRCLVLSSADFMGVFRRHPDVALAVTRLLAERLRSLTGQFIEASERSATARVASRLVVLLDLQDQTSPPIELRLPISQEELGQWAGLSREGTAKALRELREQHILTTGRNLVTVLDPDQLKDLAAGLV